MSWRFLSLLSISVLTASGCQPMNEPQTEVPVPRGQLGATVAPIAYRLNLTIDADAPRFSGETSIEVQLAEATRSLYLHGADLTVSGVALTTGDTTIAGSYQQVDDSGVARVTLEAEAPAGPATLTFAYSAPFNESLSGLYRVASGTNENAAHYAFTQFEATSARLAFPGFDEPRFKTPFDITVTSPSEHAVIATTPVVSQAPNEDGWTTYTFATTTPLPTYLLAFATGPLDVVTYAPVPTNQVRDRELPLRGVAVEGKGPLLVYALERTAPILGALERYFGTPYPYRKLDLIAVPDFGAGAMENVGAITYREQLLLISNQSSLDLKRAFASVHAHELAHMWFGNLVTPRWWNDIWLNESFATWMGNKAIHLWRPQDGFANLGLHAAHRVMKSDSLTTARQIRNPVPTNDDIGGAFDGISYAKGGAVLEMFEAYVGDAEFQAGVRLHLDRFAHDVADVDDFLDSVAEGSGHPELKEAFSSFLYQPGVPLVTARLQCEDDAATVKLEQQRYLPLGSKGEPAKTWQVPVCLAFENNGERARHCSLLTASSAEVQLPTQSCPQWMMPNESSNGYYRWSLDTAGWQALFEHFEALNEREHMGLMANLAAGYHAGQMSTATLVEALPVMAASSNREVAAGPVDHLELLYERLATDPLAKEGISQLTRSLYRSRLDAIGLDGTSLADQEDPTDTALLRSMLLGSLLAVGRDPELRMLYKDKAVAWLGDREINPDSLHPDLVGMALKVAVQDSDLEFAKTLLDRALTSDDLDFRQKAFNAIVSSKDPAAGGLLQPLILDAALRNNEAIAIVYNLAASTTHRDALWTWLTENLDGFLERVPMWNRGGVVQAARGFCSAERAAEVERFFTARMDDLPGGPNELPRVLEAISLCSALQSAKQGEVNDYFGRMVDG